MKTEEEFKDIILALKELKNVGAEDDFKNRLFLKYSEGIKTNQFLMPIWRVALMTFVSVCILGGGVVFAASNSKPGNILYPVREIFENIQNNLNPDIETKNNSKTELIPTKSLTPTPTKVPLNPTAAQISPTPTSVTQTPTPTLTPVPVSQNSSVLPQAQAQINVLGTGINIGIGGNSQSPTTTISPSPTPRPGILNIDISLNKKPLIKIGL